MKFFIIFAFAVCTATASLLSTQRLNIQPRELSEVISPEGRITNGKDAVEGQFPYQVGLSFPGWFCGGSLISNEWILTAAHCTSGASKVTIYLGATLRTNAKVTIEVTKTAFTQHKAYNHLTTNNDISLIRIPSVTYTDDIHSVALPKKISVPYSYSGQIAIASGWGLVSDAETAIATKLQYTPLKVIDNIVCTKSYGPLTVTATTLCTASPGGTSTCQGDSGGPLVLESSNVLIGVTSFVHKKGCESGAPAGFVRVTSYLDWIEKNTGLTF